MPVSVMQWHMEIGCFSNFSAINDISYARDVVQYSEKLCCGEIELWRNLVSANLKLKKLVFLLRVKLKFFALAFLRLEFA